MFHHIGVTLRHYSLFELADPSSLNLRISLGIKWRRFFTGFVNFVWERWWGLTFSLRFGVVFLKSVWGHICQGRILLASVSLHRASHQKHLFFHVVLVFSIFEQVQLRLVRIWPRQGAFFLESKPLVNGLGDSYCRVYLLLLNCQFLFFLFCGFGQLYQIFSCLVDQVFKTVQLDALPGNCAILGLRPTGFELSGFDILEVSLNQVADKVAPGVLQLWLVFILARRQLVTLEFSVVLCQVYVFTALLLGD